jgi:ABC-2 type transport system ATP-binding protein
LVFFVAAPVLTATRLSRRFGDRIALEDVSFNLEAGEIFALLGPNGAGKTTTLRILAGLIAPSAGSVTVDGEPMGPQSAPRLRARIGFLTEAPGLWDRLTVRQNLRVYARLYGLSSPDATVEAALERFEIRGRGNDRAAQLSKGLKQRVALARSLLHDPRIAMLDEPTSGLDPESARDVRDLILGLRNQGRTVLLCTHNLDEVERVADRVAVLSRRLVAIGTPSSLRERLYSPRVRVVLTQPAAPYAATLRQAGIADVTADEATLSINITGSSLTTPDLVRRLVEAGASIESVIQEEPPLEDVYLKLLQAEGRAS